MLPETQTPATISGGNAERRVLLQGVPWSTYVVLRDSVDSPGLRMTYLNGLLEIMSPSRQHEVEKKLIARLLELFALERDIPLYGYGSTTFREELKERGLEPDECYCRDEDLPIPQVAIEVVVSSPLIDKLEVYRGLGIREVWVFEDGGFELFALRGERYEEIARSEVFPEVDFELLSKYAVRLDQHAALKEFRARIKRQALD